MGMPPLRAKELKETEINLIETNVSDTKRFNVDHIYPKMKNKCKSRRLRSSKVIVS